MAIRLLKMPRRKDAPPGPAQPVPPASTTPARKAGSALTVSVTVDPQLGADGATLANDVLQIVQGCYDQTAAFFNLTTRPSVVCEIAALSAGHDGTGGAYHMSCTDTTLVCDAAFGQPDRTAALFVAELVEVFEAAIGNGWNCGDTNGEALSRCISEEVQPGQLDDYSTAATWLDTPDRPDWISNQQGTDTDPVSVGCGVLFLWWLIEEKGCNWQEIVAAGGSTLAMTYQSLALGSNAYSDFRAACDAAWPVGSPSNVTTDNPWPSLTPTPSPVPAPTPTPTPTPAPAGTTLTLAGDVAAGSYLLMPAPSAATMSQFALPPGTLLKLFQAFLQVVLPLLLQVQGQQPQGNA